MRHSKPANHCALVLPDDIASVEQLRIVEYGRGEDMTLTDPRVLRWSSKDDASIVLAVWSDRSCVATMRGNVLATCAEAEEMTGLSLKGIGIGFPCLLLSRAATAQEWRGKGLNTLLRLHFLRLAIQSEVVSLIGDVNLGAPRLHLLRELGYHDRPIPELEEGMVSKQGSAIVHFDVATEGCAALKKLEQRTLKLVQQFPWHGIWPSLPLSAQGTGIST